MNVALWKRLALVPAAVLCAGWFLLPSRGSDASPPADTATTYASVRDEVLGVLDHEGPGPALAKLDELRRGSDDVANICHAVGHDLGRAALHKAAGFAEALSFPADFCSGGYVHGLVEERLKEEKDPAAALPGICGPDPIENCVHGLGHGAMLITGNNLPEAVRMCDRLPDDKQRRWCGDGVFMQHFGSGADPAHADAFLDAKDPGGVCKDQPEEYEASCKEYVKLYELIRKRGPGVGMTG